MSVTFSEVRSSTSDSALEQVVQRQSSTARSEREDGFLKIVNAVMRKQKKSQGARARPSDSDGSPPRPDSAGPAAAAAGGGGREPSPGAEAGSSASSPEPVKQRGLLSWKRRRLSLKPATRSKGEPLPLALPDGPDGRDVGPEADVDLHVSDVPAVDSPPPVSETVRTTFIAPCFGFTPPCIIHADKATRRVC